MCEKFKYEEGRLIERTFYKINNTTDMEKLDTFINQIEIKGNNTNTLDQFDDDGTTIDMIIEEIGNTMNVEATLPCGIIDFYNEINEILKYASITDIELILLMISFYYVISTSQEEEYISLQTAINILNAEIELSKIGMKSTTVEKRVAKHLNLNESKKLLSTALNSDQRYKIRNYTITCLFLNCCLRLSELIQIDLTDLKLDERTLKVYGKGNIERIVYLNDAVLEALTEYLKVRPSLGKDNIDYNALFISSRNKRISKKAVQSIIKEELNMTFGEAKNGLHTHTLRHTGATLMYNENDTNILVLKKVLGHKSIAANVI